MENALYYTLSTIAQTLAGALAVLVAIVLFRLQRLEDLISKGQALLQSKSTPYAESWPILRDQGWAAVSDFMTSKGDDPLRERGARQISEGAYQTPDRDSEPVDVLKCKYLNLIGGRSRARTCDPGLVRAVLFQLSYPPVP